MQRYQNSIISGDIKAIVADANAALRRLGISAAVLAQPDIQAQLSQAIAAMGITSQYGVDITVTVAGGAQ
jgi:SLT domain-containing protein